MLENQGIDMDPKNTTKSDTCGLDPVTAAAALGRHQVPHSSNGECLFGLPRGVSFHSNYECKKGKLQSSLILTFPGPMEQTFTCVYNPTCMEGGYESHILCYTLDAEFNIMRSNHNGSTFHLLAGLLVTNMLWLWILQ